MFSSYGSPSGHRLDDQAPTPIILLPSQRISLLQHGQLFLLSENLKDYIWEITCGHPSAVRSPFDGLACADAFRQYRKLSVQITLEAVQEFLSDDTSFLNCIENSKMHGFCRGLPEKYILQANPAVSQFLRELVVGLGSADNLNSNPALNMCYRRGWLQAELLEDNKPIYIFSTGIHRRYMEHILCINTPPFPLHLFPAIEDLNFSAIREFKPAALRVEQRGSAFTQATRPLEATFQNEFYRACYELLGKRYIFPPMDRGNEGRSRGFSGQRDSLGYRNTSGWGQNLDEHVARFESGGRYFPWLQTQEIQEYIILDFRRSHPPKKPGYDRLFYVVFSEDYTTYQLYNSKLDLIGDAGTLLA
ncbi:hypothetical protein GX50_02742 [[Emmonsia] crescens]|uniref:Uncharacterized protein n=1 Tax=[Emmonsia] crescens TaxID=73230 RepID=A0A2B7ZL75_9EURO|nr:hypothetical protein GX50_02742 [Emmonsia crescens]